MAPVRKVRKQLSKAKRKILTVFDEFDQLESSGGLVLMACSLLALIWANTPWAASYFELARFELGFDLDGLGIRMPLLLWVNDGLMALFFFVVGLEIKRELISGELSSARSAALPAFAALGGLVAPAAIYAAINWGSAGATGWGVPIATDIAFTLAVLSLLGPRVPTELKVFVTALAIVDDIGALAVIAIFYSKSLDLGALAGAAGVLLAVFLLSRFRVRSWLMYGSLGVVLWLLLLKSGVHATIAGVLLALFIPAKAEPNKTSPLEQAEHALLPWTSYLVIPLFGLLNAGITLGPSPWRALADPIPMGIVAGLMVGKPVGIFAASWLAVRLKVAALPSNVAWMHVAGAALLAGIGFTMSIFIAELAFTAPEQVSAAKFGVLVASLAAAVLGSLWMKSIRQAKLA